MQPRSREMSLELETQSWEWTFCCSQIRGCLEVNGWEEIKSGYIRREVCVMCVCVCMYVESVEKLDGER